MNLKKIVSLAMALFMCTSSAYGHSGRTDSSGGHKDNKNVSGLGPYHYHCGGYPAHLHTNGVCPYSSSSNNSSSSSNSNSKPSSSAPVTAPNPNRNNVYLMHTMPQMTVGETYTAEAVSNNQSAALTWSSSNPNIATVDSVTGLVTAKSVGTAIITVSNGYKSASYTVTCKGYISYTNTQAQINNNLIQLYTYNGDYYILCSDLNNYGFDANYDAYNALVTITLNKSKTPMPNTVISYPEGKIAYVVQETAIDVLCGSNSSYSKSINGDGKMFVALDSLAVFGNIVYDNPITIQTY